jgi:diacylglycerol kinase
MYADSYNDRTIQHELWYMLLSSAPQVVLHEQCASMITMCIRCVSVVLYVLEAIVGALCAFVNHTGCKCVQTAYLCLCDHDDCACW